MQAIINETPGSGPGARLQNFELARNSKPHSENPFNLNFLDLGELADAEPITGFELRPYQAEAVAGIFKSWEQFDRVLGIAPTGSGKTVIFADIAQKRLAFGRVLVLAHRDELIDQAIDKLYRARQLPAAKEKATRASQQR
jgi:superfamily II DNA or RNA helicase